MTQRFQSGIPVLLDWARRNTTIDIAALEAALKFINPPQDLRLLDLVLGGLLDLWPALDAFNPDDWSTSDARALEKLATALVAQPSEIQTLVTPRQTRGDPLARIMTDAPVYCLLSHRLDKGRRDGPLPPILKMRDERFAWFLFWVLDAARRLHLHPQKFTDDESATLPALVKRNHGLVCGAERSLRRLTRGFKGYSPSLLDRFGSVDVSTVGLVDELDDARKSKDSTVDLAGFSNNLYLLLSTVHTGRERRKISTRIGTRRAGDPPRGSPTPSPTEPDEVLTQVHDTAVDDVVLTDFYSKNEAREAVATGLAPDDLGKTRTVRTSNAPVELSAGDSLIGAAFRDREAMAAIASKNQYLPYDLARLSLFELVALDEALQDLASGASGFSPEEVSAAELAAFISLTLWTGASLDSVLATTVTRTRSGLSKDWSANQVRLIARTLQWLPPRLIIPDRAPANDEWISMGMVHPVVSHLELPIPAPLARYVTDLMAEVCARRARPTEQPLFQSEPEALRRRAAKFLGFIKQISGVTRLTLDRVGSHLFNSITRETSDVIDACMITGRSPPGHNSAPFYYAPQTSALEAAYLATVDTIDRQIQGNDVKAGRRAIRRQHEVPPSARIGSANCPTDEFLKTFVHGALIELKARRQHLAHRPSIATWVNFHNYLVSYCVMMLGYATGLRAVNSPFAKLDSFDAETGFLVVHEKDSAGSTAPRLVWLPEVCVRQFEAYQAHLAELAEALALLGCEFADGMTAATAGARGVLFPRTSGNKWVPVHESQRARRSVQPPPFLFLLAEDAQRWQHLRPTAVSALMGYPILRNSNRHYLRTRLRDMEVAGEVVDALMGHGAYGQQPYSEFSTLSPLDFRAMVQGPISTLMANMGWEVVREASAQ